MIEIQTGAPPFEIVVNRGPLRIQTGGPGLRGLPGAPGTGDVMGASVATDGHIVLFDGDGKHLKDSGKALSDLATATQGDKADSAVQAVNGKTGTNVTLDPSDIGAATEDQGDKADTALQPEIIDDDGALAANSDALLPTQKAVKTYVDRSQSVVTEYGVMPYRAAGIGLTYYPATRRAPHSSMHSRLYAEIVNSDPTGAMTFMLMIDGVMVSGPHAVALGAPLDLSGLTIDVPDAAEVGFAVSAMSGNVTQFYADLFGAP